jgi:hypothetical protein
MSNFEKIKSALRQNVEAVINEVAVDLAHLGSKPEWDMEDNFMTTEGIVALADRFGLPRAGDQDDEGLAFYRAAAAEIGLGPYDDDEDYRDGAIGAPR